MTREIKDSTLSFSRELYKSGDIIEDYDIQLSIYSAMLYSKPHLLTDVIDVIFDNTDSSVADVIEITQCITIDRNVPVFYVDLSIISRDKKNMYTVRLDTNLSGGPLSSTNAIRNYMYLRVMNKVTQLLLGNDTHTNHTQMSGTKDSRTNKVLDRLPSDTDYVATDDATRIVIGNREINNDYNTNTKAVVSAIKRKLKTDQREYEIIITNELKDILVAIHDSYTNIKDIVAYVDTIDSPSGRYTMDVLVLIVATNGNVFSNIFNINDRGNFIDEITVEDKDIELFNRKSNILRLVDGTDINSYGAAISDNVLVISRDNNNILARKIKDKLPNSKNAIISLIVVELLQIVDYISKTYECVNEITGYITTMVDNSNVNRDALVVCVDTIDRCSDMVFSINKIGEVNDEVTQES